MGRLLDEAKLRAVRRADLGITPPGCLTGRMPEHRLGQPIDRDYHLGIVRLLGEDGLVHAEEDRPPTTGSFADAPTGYSHAMTVLALLLALAAIFCFAAAASVRARAQAPFWVPVGLGLLTAAWIVQTLGWTHPV